MPESTPSGRRSRRRATSAGLLAATAAVALAVTACSSSASKPAAAVPPQSGASSTAQLSGAQRCDANKKAGPITFLTGYGFFPSLSVADVIAAQQQGYYKQMCLNVKIVPSLPGQSALLLSANKIQFNSTDMGSVTADVQQGSRETIVYNEGNLPIDTLIVPANSKIKTLADFKGATIGIGGTYLGAPVQAMLASAGLQKNKDYKVVNIGYDLLQLKTNSALDAEAGYRSSNPQSLQAAGFPIRQFFPEDYGVAGSFAAIGASTIFIGQHPTAAEDFDDPRGVPVDAIDPRQLLQGKHARRLRPGARDGTVGDRARPDDQGHACRPAVRQG